MGRRASRGSQRDPAARGGFDPPDARRTRHLAFHRQPQRPRAGHGETATNSAWRTISSGPRSTGTPSPIRSRKSPPGSAWDWTRSRSLTISLSSGRKSRLRHPKVLCIDAAELAGIPDLKRMHPRFITEESRSRRQMYQSDVRTPGSRARIHRDQRRVPGPKLNMVFTISKVSEEDLKRAEELTLRTHQLNTTGTPTRTRTR